MTNDDDCNDSNPNIYKNAPEICNGIDDNCNGKIDEGLQTRTYYVDADGDGRGDMNKPGIRSCSPVPGYVTNDNDCNDSNPNIYKNAPERCNGIDDNCNGKIDEGCPRTNAKVIETLNEETDIILNDNRSIKVYPNPFHNEFKIQLEGFKADEIQLYISNTIGEILLNKTLKVNGGYLSELIDLSSYADGIYFINFISEDLRKVISVIKSK